LLENGEKRNFSYKVAGKKFSWSGQRGASHHAPPKYATETELFRDPSLGRYDGIAEWDRQAHRETDG